jgi:sarcosine oxidase subunit gamma
MGSTLFNGIRLESPLVGRSLDAAMLHYGDTIVRECPFRGHLNLRGDAADDQFTDCVARIVGVALPLTPNTARDSDERTVCWLCPSEWLIVCPGNDEQRLADQLREGLRSRFASVVQIGGGQTVWCLEGDSARELLARGCPLDLHPRVFTIGQCAQTHVAKAPVLLRPIVGAIELVVRRSFADYLWQWLKAAAVSIAA